jgi:hypothetical protein
MKKFLKNMNNLVDLVLSSLYTIYSIERTIFDIFHIFKDDFDMNIGALYILNPKDPDATRTQPNGFFACGIAMLFSVWCLSFIKLLLMLRTNETMNKLFILVKRCLAASIPFLVFFFTWCLIFEILYKNLGELSRVEQNGDKTYCDKTNIASNSTI